MEPNGAPPQWFVVFVRLSLQVQKAAVSWQTITGSPMASEFAINTPAGPMGKRQQKKNPSIYSTCFLFLLIYVCLCQLPSLLWPNSSCPFSYCDDILHVFCICVINTWDLLNNLFTFVMFLQPEAISTFTSEPALVSFAKFFCKTSEDNNYVS